MLYDIFPVMGSGEREVLLEQFWELNGGLCLLPFFVNIVCNIICVVITMAVFEVLYALINVISLLGPTTFSKPDGGDSMAYMMCYDQRFHRCLFYFNMVLLLINDLFSNFKQA